MNMHARLLLAGALALCGFGVQAQSAPEADVAAQDAPAATAKADAKADDDAHCLRYTGSLIVSSQNRRNDRRHDGAAANADARPNPRCIYNAGRVYTRDDIQATGQSDIGRALQMLDPSVTIGH